MEKENLHFISSDLLQFITNVGFVGIERGYFLEAQEIFEAVVEACPKNLDAKIVQAMGELMMGHLTNGTKILFEVLKQNSENETVKGFLALALKMAKADSEALSLSRNILQSCKDENMRSIAQDIIHSCQENMTPQALQAEQCELLSKETYVH